MRVSDVQTWGVVSVLPNDPVDRAVALMLGHKISGLPVIDTSGHLVGVLTEGDLLRRTELGTERQRPRWLEMFASPGRLAEEYTRSHTRVVSELMSTDVVTIESERSLAEAVDLMTKHGIKRIPVTDGDQVVGVVSRADILRALGRTMRPGIHQRRSDEELRAAINTELSKLPFAAGSVEVDVSLGNVTLSGAIMDDRERNALRVAVENVPGVQSVRDELVWIEPAGVM